ncbi:Eukaryotic translation initiation factor 2 subunit alpha-like protein [Bienertia sinuspersici]
MASGGPNLECRMYESKYPEVDMAVMIQVQNIADMGAYVSLLEYNNIEGMILFSELSRRRIRSVNSLIRVGRTEPVMVLRVDKEKGYIDLSKRRVSEEDITQCEERYNKSKLVHSIMRHVAETTNIDLEDLYIRMGWPLYRKYGHAFEAFKVIVNDPDTILDPLTYEVKETGPDGQEVTKVVPAVTPEIKDALIKNIRRRMTPQPLKIRADIEMKCFQFDGVLHIKEAMRKAEAAGTEDCPVKIKLVAPPLYVLTTQTLDKLESLRIVRLNILALIFFTDFVTSKLFTFDLLVGASASLVNSFTPFLSSLSNEVYKLTPEQGMSTLTKAIEACTQTIECHKGKLFVKDAPRTVSERDDKLLQDTMDKLRRGNEEKHGDSDSEDEEDTGMGDVDVENSAGFDV